LMSIEEYLEKMAAFAGDEYGKRIRGQFKDINGSSELAMLQTPSKDELKQLQRAVAVMTEAEKERADKLGDEEVLKIAEDAKVDSALFAIFINGYALESKRVL
jgi:hypothetical protein